MPLVVKKVDYKAKAAKLEAEIAELELELGPDVEAEKIVKRHIELLHQYNEAKDAALILMGRLAAIKQVTIRETHEEYGVTAED